MLLHAWLLAGVASAQDAPDRTTMQPAEPDKPVRLAQTKALPKGEPAAEGDIVDELAVSGNRRVDAESVLNQVRLQKGQAIRLSTLGDDIRRIYKLNFFEDVRVDATRTADGRVVVTYVVTEKPAVTEIAYEGNSEIELEDIQGVVNIQPNSVLDVSAIKINAEKIRQLYTEKGFFLAEVDYVIETQPETPESARIVFQIREYAKVEVRRVTFLGNANIPDDELKNIMATREGDWGSFLTSFGAFKEEAFQQDIQRVTAYYYDKGFVQVKVKRPVVRLSRDKRYLFITIAIDEGQKFDVGDVDIQGDFIVPKEELVSKIVITPDTTFSVTTMRRDIETLRREYMDAGYAYVNINQLTRVREAERKVDITYDIQKGSKVYIRRIEVVGNAKTRDKVIRRELTIEEGELFSQTKIEQSKAKVTRLGFFEKVDVTTQRADRDDVIDIRVEVAERPTGTFQVGAGFSSLESFILNAQISQNNLFGRGQSLSFQSQVSSIRTLFNIQFAEPYFLDSNWSFGFDLYNFDYLFQDFARRSRGGNLTFGYPLTDEIRANFTYKLEDVELRPGGRSGRNSRQVGNLFRGGLTSSIQGGLSYDNRDNRLFPTKGTFTSGTVEWADDNVTLSQVEFVKYDAETRWYFPLIWEFVLRLNGEVGYVASTDPHKPVPLFERYYVGGPTTVRGFDRFSLGPSRLVAGDTNDPGTSGFEFGIGGNKRLILTAEIEFPILTAIGIKGVVFADAGNAFDNGKPLTLKLDLFSDAGNNYDDVLRTSVGFGFRWFSPIGPLRFEWGIPLARLRDEKPLVFDFSIGNAF
ncbi:MAG: outer membrane protein assembly factor BamA [bacterium]